MEISGTAGGPTLVSGTCPLVDNNNNEILVPDQLAVGGASTYQYAPYADGQTFTLNDGVHKPVTFEFDTLGNGVAVGNVAISLPNTTQVDGAITGAIDCATHYPGHQLVGPEHHRHGRR